LPTLKQIRLIWKPVVFALCLLPLAWLALGLAGRGGLDLGPNPVEAIQDHLGIWGLRLILATLTVTPLRLALGQAWPLQFRRMLGLFAFAYISLHFLNYLLLDQTLDVAAIAEDILERPFITIGFLALLLMVPLAITSTNGWRRRLGVRWLQLHRLVYVTAMLGCWHFYWQVKKDVTEPLIYAVILAVLLGIRLWRRLQSSPRPARAR
jgi:sulfoxide reductase heme-binding subunit YedZ